MSLSWVSFRFFPSEILCILVKDIPKFLFCFYHFCYRYWKPLSFINLSKIQNSIQISFLLCRNYCDTEWCCFDKVCVYVHTHIYKYDTVHKKNHIVSWTLISSFCFTIAWSRSFQAIFLNIHGLTDRYNVVMRVMFSDSLNHENAPATDTVLLFLFFRWQNSHRDVY